MLKRSIPLKEETGTSLFTNCYYCKEELGEDCVKDHDHLNVAFRSYFHNRCNLPAKSTIKPLYALNSFNYDNHSITKLSKKIILHGLAKTDANSFNFGLVYAKALVITGLFHPLMLGAMKKN